MACPENRGPFRVATGSAARRGSRRLADSARPLANGVSWPHAPRCAHAAEHWLRASRTPRAGPLIGYGSGSARCGATLRAQHSRLRPPRGASSAREGSRPLRARIDPPAPVDRHVRGRPLGRALGVPRFRLRPLAHEHRRRSGPYVRAVAQPPQCSPTAQLEAGRHRTYLRWRSPAPGAGFSPAPSRCGSRARAYLRGSYIVDYIQARARCPRGSLRLSTPGMRITPRREAFSFAISCFEHRRSQPWIWCAASRRDRTRGAAHELEQGSDYCSGLVGRIVTWKRLTCPSAM